MTRFRPLQRHSLPDRAELVLFDNGLPSRVQLEDPAIKVMTDLHRLPAAQVHTDVSLDEAHQRMIHVGVRLLFVVDGVGDLVGLITARDLLGEKPVSIAAAQQVARDQLHVQDIMVPRDKIEVLDFAEVERSNVGDVVVTMREMARQHALVQEMIHEQPRIRGIFSVSQISRQLGIAWQSGGAVQSFAELEQRLAHEGL